MALICNSIRVCQPVLANLYWFLHISRGSFNFSAAQQFPISGISQALGFWGERVCRALFASWSSPCNRLPSLMEEQWKDPCRHSRAQLAAWGPYFKYKWRKNNKDITWCSWSSRRCIYVHGKCNLYINALNFSLGCRTDFLSPCPPCASLGHELRGCIQAVSCNPECWAVSSVAARFYFIQTGLWSLCCWQHKTIKPHSVLRAL